MLTSIFWLSLLLLFYIYIGYPLVVAMCALKAKKVACNDQFLPHVSILIAAYNEEKDIVATLNNKLQQKYPRDKLEILVVSDESTDETDQLVEEFALTSDVPVRLIRQMPRAGKTSGLNLLVPESRGDILLFSDANSLWSTDAVALLVSNFADATVGYVTGKMVYVNSDGSLIGDGCSSYMKYENWLRGKETSIGSIVGVDGGVDAVRKQLYSDMRADQLPDFVLPLSVVTQGYRVIYAPTALLKEYSLSTVESEYRMRVRVTLRAMWALLDMKHLLNCFKFPVFSWQLISHKVLRYLAFIPMLSLWVANIGLLGNPFYEVLLMGQLLFYALALVGHYSNGASQPFYLSLPYYFVVVNLACAHAFFRFLRGEKQAVWNPRVG